MVDNFAEAILITYDTHDQGERILILRGDKLRGYEYSSRRVNGLLDAAELQGDWRAREELEFTTDNRTRRKLIVRRYL